MISFLTGKVIKSLAHGVILNVAGVGYELNTPLPLLAFLTRQNEDISLWVYTKVREDAIKLFGFYSWQERQTFEILIQINGVGPKVALAILSTLSLTDLRDSIEKNEPEIFLSVPGIGKRTAEKMLVELRPRLEKLPFASEVEHSPNVGYEKTKQGSLGFAVEFEEQQKNNSWKKSISIDLSSALENLGFKIKDINPVLKTLEKEYTGEDFSELVRRALQLISGKKPLLKKGKAPIKVEENINFSDVF